MLTIIMQTIKRMEQDGTELMQITRYPIEQSLPYTELSIIRLS